MPTSTSGVYIPLPMVQDWPDEDVMPTKKRHFWAAYVEDIWDIMADLRLTLGGRYDHYSDFGGQFSPRVGINYEFLQNYYTKFLYGRGTYLGMNYTHLNRKAHHLGWESDSFSWFEPHQLGTLTANIRLNRYLNLNTYLLYRGGWTRAEGDPRDDPGDYVLVNAALIAKNFLKELKGLEVRGSAHKLHVSLDFDFAGSAHGNVKIVISGDLN